MGTRWGSCSSPSLVPPSPARSFARPSLPFPGPHSARTRKIEQKSSKSGGVTEFVWLAELRSARRAEEVSAIAAAHSFLRRRPPSRSLGLSCSALLPRVRVPLLPHSRAVCRLAVLRRRRMRWSSWSQSGLTDWRSEKSSPSPFSLPSSSFLFSSFLWVQQQ